MKATAIISGLPPDFAAEFQEALDDLAKGVRRPEKMQAACERMDRLREKTGNSSVSQNLAVELVRQGRDEV